MSDRWQDEPERATRITGLLAEVERMRRQLEAARAAAAEDDVPRYELADRQRRVRGAEGGLRAAIGMAVLDRTPPPDADVARAAGWAVEQVARQRDVLNASTRA